MRTPPRGFSLVELLVVIAIVAILAAVVMTGFQRARSISDRAAASSNMRSIGLAMQSYANDHDGSLPGPLNYGQSPRYRKNSTGQLGYFLWSYLEGTEPVNNTWLELPALTSPAYLQQRDSTDDVIYLVQRNVHIRGQSGVPPFGYPERADSPAVAPLTVQTINLYDLRDEWALQDVDQQHPDVAGWNTATYLPEPIHGNVRMTLYFDWSVSPVPVNQEGGS